MAHRPLLLAALLLPACTGISGDLMVSDGFVEGDDTAGSPCEGQPTTYGWDETTPGGTAVADIVAMVESLPDAPFTWYVGGADDTVMRGSAELIGDGVVVTVWEDAGGERCRDPEVTVAALFSVATDDGAFAFDIDAELTGFDGSADALGGTARLPLDAGTGSYMASDAANAWLVSMVLRSTGWGGSVTEELDGDATLTVGIWDCQDHAGCVE